MAMRSEAGSAGRAGPWPRAATIARVSSIYARVVNRRLVLDQPTSLPEGAEGRLWVVEGDDLEDADRARLHEAINEGLADAKAGRAIDADEWAATLRTRSCPQTGLHRPHAHARRGKRRQRRLAPRAPARPDSSCARRGIATSSHLHVVPRQAQ